MMNDQAPRASTLPNAPSLAAQPAPPAPPSASYHFGFLMQQVLGHITAYQNLRRFVAEDASVAPTWTEVTYEEPGGWIERLPLVPAGVKGVARGALQVRGGLSQRPYDAVLFNSQSLCLFVRGYMRRVPSVIVTDVTPHQYDLMGEFYNHPRPKDSAIARYKHRVNVDVYRSARLIVPWSHWAKGSLMQDYGVPEEKIIVLPPGVDIEQWTPPPAGTREARQAEAGRLPGILFVGGDFERKGGSLLLDWFLTRGKDRCELHLVTRQPPTLAEPVPGLHIHVNLKTNGPELMRLYAENDLFVLPTRADCFGLALIEAMSTGLPVITTGVGGVPDIVDDGQQGFLIEPNDGAALAERIERALADASLRRSMGASARAKVLSHFDAAKNSRRQMELMKALVSTPATASDTSPQ